MGESDTASRSESSLAPGQVFHALAVARARTVEPAPDLRVKVALRSLDDAGTFDELQAARAELAALGPVGLPSLLVELSSPQPPDRFDALVTALLRAASLEEISDNALARGASHDLRASLATALGFISQEQAIEPRRRSFLLDTLRSLLRDTQAGVRAAAAEAIGVAGLSEARGELEAAARGDSNGVVRSAARAGVDAIS